MNVVKKLLKMKNSNKKNLTPSIYQSLNNPKDAIRPFLLLTNDELFWCDPPPDKLNLYVTSHTQN